MTLDPKKLEPSRLAVNRIVAASTAATAAQKAAARETGARLRDQYRENTTRVDGKDTLAEVIRAFAFNGYLLCVAEHKPLTDTMVIDATKRVYRAQEAYYAKSRLTPVEKALGQAA